MICFIFIGCEEEEEAPSTSSGASNSAANQPTSGEQPETTHDTAVPSTTTSSVQPETEEATQTASDSTSGTIALAPKELLLHNLGEMIGPNIIVYDNRVGPNSKDHYVLVADDTGAQWIFHIDL